MFSDNGAVATLAVRDLAKAKTFYGETLGLPLADERAGVLTYRTGSGLMFVYESQFAGTNKATAVTFQPDDVAASAKELAAKGVKFEHYDNVPELVLQGDVYVGNGMTVCWFADPDGNIISLVGES